MRENYDLFNGGLEQLEKDLVQLEKMLLQVNDEFVKDVGLFTKERIVSNASLADEDDTVSDIQTKTDIELSKIGSKSIALVMTNSPKASYAEFGYGIVGAGTYNHNEFIVGFEKYGQGSKIKKDGRWYYNDRSGKVHMTYGSTAKHIYFYSGQETILMIPSIFSRYKGRLGLKWH